MSILDELARLSAAEEFFDVLGVGYEPAIVNVARLHILRRMGQYLSNTDLAGMDDDAVRAACRETLERAYTDFRRSSPIAERLFKVHRDAIKPQEPAPQPFVPLAAITGGNA